MSDGGYTAHQAWGIQASRGIPGLPNGQAAERLREDFGVLIREAEERADYDDALALRETLALCLAKPTPHGR